MILAYLTNRYARASDTFIRGEVEHLRALGHEVHTFSIRRPAADEVVGEEVRREYDQTDYILAGGLAGLLLAVIRLGWRRPRRLLTAVQLAWQLGWPGMKGRIWPQAYLAEACYLATRLEALGIEHLHNHIGEGCASVALLASELSGVPFSLTIHGPGEFDQPTLLALGEKVRRSAFTAAISHYGRSQLYRWCHWEDWSKIKVVRCGVDEWFLSAARVPIPESPRLVSVGRLSEQKGPLLLVEAAGRLAADGIDFELNLVGDGPLRGPIEARIRELGLQNQVHLLGWRDTEGVRKELLRSRAMVLPSFAEGLPVVLMEALALGRPAISTYVAGIPELVVPGVSGWLVPAGSVEALAEAMRTALSTPLDDMEHLGQAGAEAVATRHNRRANVERLANLFAGTQSRNPFSTKSPKSGQDPNLISKFEISKT
jgi:colanic acid/amylovoran biosynthesis glycosyltransferase